MTGNRLRPKAELRILDARLFEWGTPRYHSDMAGAIDVFACVDDSIVLEPGTQPILIPSGMAIHLGDGNFAAILLPRSGKGHHSGLVLGNSVGLIDADYTGQIMISAWNRNGEPGKSIVIRPGDRIAQLMFVPVARPEFVIVDSFSTESDRTGGFGSTG